MSETPQISYFYLFVYHIWGAWDSILASPNQEASLIPLCHADWHLTCSWNLTSSLRIIVVLHENIVGSNPPTSYSWPSWSGRTGWGDHTLLRLLIYHSTPSIYLSYLTLYKGQLFARNIYTRNMALSIFLWLYEYFCLLIFALYYFKIVFFHTWVKPLCRPVPDFNSLRPPRGQIDLYAFLISIIGC